MSSDERRFRNSSPTAPPISFAEALQKGFARNFRISGFTFVRNGVRFAYPFRESILSLLPSVDELIVNVGESDDGTLEIVQALADEFSKIKVITSKWDDSLREGGRVLAQQTDIALAACTGKWAIYLQADEVLHEDDIVWVLDALRRADADPKAEGLLFDYLHFYGSHGIVNWNPSAYRHEVRAVKLGQGVFSYGDAQGFRVREADGSSRKLRVLRANARVYHYGWVRPPEEMRIKTEAMDRLYHSDGGGTGDNYKYKRIYGLERFTGTHPMVMRDQIEKTKNNLGLLEQPLHFRLPDIRKVFARIVEKATGKRLFEYRNYQLLD
jgi:glycosyltransferase involved in cell wall biosynthesis